MRVFGETTNSLSVTWDHADGPVQQYRIIYSPTVGDPIDEYVSVMLGTLYNLIWLEGEFNLSFICHGTFSALKMNPQRRRAVLGLLFSGRKT